MPGAGHARRVASLAAFVLLFLAARAGAVLARQYYDEMRDRAPFVVVLDVADVRFASMSNSRMYGTCTIAGTIAEVRRDRLGRLRPGETIAVRAPCVGEEEDEPLVGGTLWSEFAKVRAARRLELFLDADFGVAAQGGGLTILDPR